MWLAGSVVFVLNGLLRTFSDAHWPWPVQTALAIAFYALAAVWLRYFVTAIRHSDGR